MKNTLLILCLSIFGFNVQAQSFETLLDKAPKSDEVYQFLMKYYDFETKAAVDSCWNGKDATMYFRSDFHIKYADEIFSFGLTMRCEKGKITRVQIGKLSKACSTPCSKHSNRSKIFPEEFEGGVRLNWVSKDAEAVFGKCKVVKKVNKYSKSKKVMVRHTYTHHFHSKYKCEIVFNPSSDEKKTARIVYTRK